VAKILITGSTGNIGKEVIRALSELNTSDEVIACGKNLDDTRRKLKEFEKLSFRQLDFSDPSGFEEALRDIEVVFLLRPPNLADIPKYFGPFFKAIGLAGVKKVVFLSVQGVEDQTKIPHHKMEQLIKDMGVEYVFLRPSYFMQNLTSTLLPDILEKRQLYIPAGNVKFTWVDVRDIGKVAAKVLVDFEVYKSRALEITGSEEKDFTEVAAEMTKVLGMKIEYVSPNLCAFFLKKKKQGVATPMIFVMIILHYLPRFQKTKNKLSNTVKEITGDDPGLLKEFLDREKGFFE
jgi:uncharacterized protein YbjT (DUF2867 family)